MLLSVAAMKRLNKVISLLIFEVTAVIKPYFAMDEMSIKAFVRFCSPKQARSHRTVIFELIFFFLIRRGTNLDETWPLS